MEIDRALRHDAMNLINALKLNLEALEWSESLVDRLECLDAIEEVADTGEALAERLGEPFVNEAG